MEKWDQPTKATRPSLPKKCLNAVINFGKSPIDNVGV